MGKLVKRMMLCVMMLCLFTGCGKSEPQEAVKEVDFHDSKELLVDYVIDNYKKEWTEEMIRDVYIIENDSDVQDIKNTYQFHHEVDAVVGAELNCMEKLDVEGDYYILVLDTEFVIDGKEASSPAETIVKFVQNNGKYYLDVHVNTSGYQQAVLAYNNTETREKMATLQQQFEMEHPGFMNQMNYEFQMLQSRNAAY